MMDQVLMKLAAEQVQFALDNLGVNRHTFPETEKTPQRVVKMWANEFFANVGKPFCDFYLSPNNTNGEIIHFPNIRFVSCCAHHLLPFAGTAHLLYIPDNSLVGASKPARLIEHYCKRPQLQETLINDIVDQFVKYVEPLGIMVVMYATHDCMGCRGVKQYASGMGVSAVRGVFANEKELELKGYELIKLSKGML